MNFPFLWLFLLVGQFPIRQKLVTLFKEERMKKKIHSELEMVKAAQELESGIGEGVPTGHFIFKK